MLTELIAVGGMAEVYRAKIFGASGFEKEMVVKRILAKYAGNPEFVQMMIDEAKNAVNLTHGNIIPIYELGEIDGTFYIAMEYVKGQTILDLLRTAHGRKRNLSWQYCIHIAAGVAAGLGYAHERTRPDGSPLGLIHRDVNPRNIVVTVDGEVKILDFGIARSADNKAHTASGVIKGTPGYMSPEQMYGHAIDGRSDLYCVGILLHEILTLRRLFPVWTVKEMRKFYKEKPPEPPSKYAGDLPAEVDKIVNRMLAEDPNDRYQSGGELEHALRQAIATSGTATTSYGLAQELQKLEAESSSMTAAPPQHQEDPFSLVSPVDDEESALPLPEARGE